MTSFSKSNKFRLLLAIIFVIVTLVFLLPDEGKFKYEYQRGRPWMYETLISPIDFPILKTNKELREERSAIASAVIPVYQLKSNISYREDMQSALFKKSNDSVMVDSCIKIADSLYRRGIADELPDSLYIGGVIEVRNNRDVNHIALDKIKQPQDAYSVLKEIIFNAYNYSNHEINELLYEINFPPNLIYDDKETQKSLKQAVSDISNTKGVIYTGQLVVNQGEMVTAETEQLLDSFRAEYEVSVGFLGNHFLLKTGHFFIVLSIIFLFSVVLYFLDKSLLFNPRTISFLLLLFLLIAVSSVIVMDSGDSYLYIIPYSVIPLYLASFFSVSVVVPVFMTLMLPVVFISSQGIELYLMNVIAGSAAFYTFRYWNRGWLQFVNSVFIFLALSLLFISFRLIEEGSFDSLEGSVFVYFAWNSLLVFAAYPFLFLLEKLFGLVSNSRLRDLSDATSSLLRNLAEEAPGTFHHSLQVANLSEGAAREIGANALLTRVGALYHDIGKIYDPLFFIENVTAGEKNLHKNLSPEKSAEVIIKHMEEGVLLARKYRLPSVVIDFITTHHGKTQTLYFYNQYVNDGGNPQDIGKFTYNGELPTSREHVIVMLADSVEAASRSLDDYSNENISELVDKIVEEKREEGQLDNSDISLKEISVVKEVFKMKLSQAYHSRIVYPERNES